MRSDKRNNLRDLAAMIVLSSLGGSTSVLVGYAGQLLSSITLFPFVTPQLLSGLHVFWLILAAKMVPIHGSATAAGALKGLIESSLFSHLSIFSFLVSLLEGAVADLVFALLKRERKATVYVAGGLSAASNLLIVQFFFLPPLPILVYALAYFAAFLSGLLFGGYLTTQVLKVIHANLQTTMNTHPNANQNQTRFSRMSQQAAETQIQSIYKRGSRDFRDASSQNPQSNTSYARTIYSLYKGAIVTAEHKRKAQNSRKPRVESMRVFMSVLTNTVFCREVK